MPFAFKPFRRSSRSSRSSRLSRSVVGASVNPGLEISVLSKVRRTQGLTSGGYQDIPNRSRRLVKPMVRVHCVAVYSFAVHVVRRLRRLAV